ncbi:MAG: hypothetical protein WC087_03025 [Candidatus Paceibacterota bacterium]
MKNQNLQVLNSELTEAGLPSASEIIGKKCSVTRHEEHSIGTIVSTVSGLNFYRHDKNSDEDNSLNLAWGIEIQLQNGFVIQGPLKDGACQCVMGPDGDADEAQNFVFEIID